MAEEVELTLRVVSEKPEEVLQNIGALRSIDGYGLIPRGAISLHDTYFDTPGLSLGKRGYALRVRRQKGSLLFALKGREEQNQWGGISRLEIEGPWSEEILDTATREIGPGPVKVQGFDQADPFKTLEAMGFVVIQSRQTVRTLMEVFLTPEKRPFGEMALDTVCYQAAGRGYLHYEIEIEAKGECRQGAIEGFASCLNHAFPGVLTPWEYNKLITGFALEELIMCGELPQAKGEKTALPLSWYGILEAWIRKKG